jgi:hypothetical protein
MKIKGDPDPYISSTGLAKARLQYVPNAFDPLGWIVYFDHVRFRALSREP